MNNKCFGYPVFLTESHVPHNNANRLHIFPYLSKVTLFVFISITTLPVEALFNRLLKYLILTFRETSKPGSWYNSPITLKFDRRIRSTTAIRPVQFQSYRSIFNIDIVASILQETWGQLSPNRYRSAGRNGEMAQGPIPGDPPRTPASVPPPPPW